MIDVQLIDWLRVVIDYGLISIKCGEKYKNTKKHYKNLKPQKTY